MVLRKLPLSTGVLGIAAICCGLIGCSSAPKGPTSAEATAAAQKLNQTQQQDIQAIRNSPNMTDDQKAAAITKLNHDETGPKFGRGAR